MVQICWHIYTIFTHSRTHSQTHTHTQHSILVIKPTPSHILENKISRNYYLQPVEHLTVWILLLPIAWLYQSCKQWFYLLPSSNFTTSRNRIWTGTTLSELQKIHSNWTSPPPPPGLLTKLPAHFSSAWVHKDQASSKEQPILPVTKKSNSLEHQLLCWQCSFH